MLRWLLVSVAVLSLAVACLVGAAAAVIIHSFNENRDYYVPSDKVAATEGKYFQHFPSKA